MIEAREGLLPEEKAYSFVEISKGAPSGEAGTKLYEFNDWDEVHIPPESALEMYVVYDREGDSITEPVPEGDNPGGKDPETGKQRAELQVIQVIDDEMGVVGIGAVMPNAGVYVDWLNDAWPDDEQLDNPHVSDYGSVADLEQATDNKVEMVDSFEGLASKLNLDGLPTGRNY